MIAARPSQWRRIATPVALAVVSLVTATVLWIAVTDAENPSRVAVFSGAIEVTAVNLPDGLAVASLREAAVTLRVNATEDTFDKLTTADFSAEVDLSGVRAPSSDQVVIARVVGNRDVEIVAVSPPLVTVTLEPTATREVPVEMSLVGSPPQGFQVGTTLTAPETVSVTGATSLVQLVDRAVADINITGLRVTTQRQYTLTTRDGRGADIRGLHVEPANADIEVEIIQQEVTLALTIVPSVQGSVADGYALVAIASDPPAIAVSGPLDLLQAQSFLATDPIDVSGLQAETVRNVGLQLPAGLQATRATVNVRLRVEPARGEMAILVAPRFLEVGEGLRATPQTPSLTVIARGEIPTLRALPPNSIEATVDLAGLTEGIRVLAATLTAPDGVEIVSFEPARVVVVISR